MGVRKIRPNRRSITGHVPSKKKPGLIAFESQLERDLIMLLEFDPLVRTVAEQPVRIRFRRREYTPDLRVTYHAHAHRLPAYVEVKYRRELFDDWHKLHPRLRMGARYARKTGHTFRVLTEVEIRTVRLQNVKKLWRYRNEDIPTCEAQQLVLALQALGRATPKQLLDAVATEAEERASVLVAIWHLVAVGKIEADLDNQHLTMSSAIWLHE